MSNNTNFNLLLTVITFILTIRSGKYFKACLIIKVWFTNLKRNK